MLRGARDEGNKKTGIQTCAAAFQRHIFFWSVAVPFSQWLPHGPQNSPRWTLGRWKDVRVPIGEEIRYSGKDTTRNGTRKRHRREIRELKFHLQHLPAEWVSACVRADATGAKHFGEMVFDYICQVVQQATLAMYHATGKFFGKCARNESNPCEIDTV